MGSHAGVKKKIQLLALPIYIIPGICMKNALLICGGRGGGKGHRVKGGGIGRNNPPSPPCSEVLLNVPNFGNWV